MLRPCPNLQFLPFLSSSSASAHRLPHRNLCPGPFGLHMTLTRRSDSPHAPEPFHFFVSALDLGFHLFCAFSGSRAFFQAHKGLRLCG